MACTTILVGKKASYDGSTLIARNDDSPSGVFCAKKLVVVTSDKQPRHYKSKLSKFEIDLPNNPLSYTSCPSVDTKEGIWAASGINSENIAMSATETITSNPRVLGADPLFKRAKDGTFAGGIGEEDLVVLVLPYIHSAKEGAQRLGSLLEKYGTYENNGIAFSDQNEIWWLETIGGHNWIARRVKDEKYVVMPNQFGLDVFDLEDAFGAQKENMCSKNLKSLIKDNFLDLNLDGEFNPRLAFGSHDDSDHIYNTPRAWFMERYFNPRTFIWDGDDATYKPECDDIPWSLVPERKITVEDVKYILSSHFQGTPYDPYSKDLTNPLKGKYRPIGVSRTSFMSISQIRPYMPKEFMAIEWICFGSNVHNAIIPIYTNTTSIPNYLSKTTLKVDTNNFYWASRLIGAMSDPYFNLVSIEIERYQNRVMNSSHQLINEFDKKIATSKDKEVTIIEANTAIATMAQEETDRALDKVLYASSCHMRNGFSRSDN
jgi:dipeptidase